jgi:hypothetical protein
MEKTSPEKLHGLLIAQAALLLSLIEALPPDTTAFLERILDSELELAKITLLNERCSDATIEAFEDQAELIKRRIGATQMRARFGRTDGGPR